MTEHYTRCANLQCYACYIDSTYRCGGFYALRKAYAQYKSAHEVGSELYLQHAYYVTQEEIRSVITVNLVIFISSTSAEYECSANFR